MGRLFLGESLHRARIIALTLGIAGVALAKTWEGARTYLVYGGVIYLVLFAYGLIFHGSSSANFVPVNWADNILHLGLGIGMITLGAVLGKDVVRRSSTAPAV